MSGTFSKIINTFEVSPSGISKTYEATKEERAALAERFRIISLDMFTFTVDVAMVEQGDYRVKGKISATVTQESVISLEPFSYDINDEFETLFSKDAVNEEYLSQDEIDLEGEDIEPLTSDQLDVGELAAEYLALAIMPFPKKDGEVFSYESENPDDEIIKSPFSKLKKLKK